MKESWEESLGESQHSSLKIFPFEYAGGIAEKVPEGISERKTLREILRKNIVGKLGEILEAWRSPHRANIFEAAPIF